MRYPAERATFGVYIVVGVELVLWGRRLLRLCLAVTVIGFQDLTRGTHVCHPWAPAIYNISVIHRSNTYVGSGYLLMRWTENQ